MIIRKKFYIPVEKRISLSEYLTTNKKVKKIDKDIFPATDNLIGNVDQYIVIYLIKKFTYCMIKYEDFNGNFYIKNKDKFDLNLDKIKRVYYFTMGRCIVFDNTIKPYGFIFEYIFNKDMIHFHQNYDVIDIINNYDNYIYDLSNYSLKDTSTIYRDFFESDLDLQTFDNEKEVVNYYEKLVNNINLDLNIVKFFSGFTFSDENIIFFPHYIYNNNINIDYLLEELSILFNQEQILYIQHFFDYYNVKNQINRIYNKKEFEGNTFSYFISLYPLLNIKDDEDLNEYKKRISDNETILFKNINSYFNKFEVIFNTLKKDIQNFNKNKFNYLSSFFSFFNSLGRNVHLNSNVNFIISYNILSRRLDKSGEPILFSLLNQYNVNKKLFPLILNKKIGDLIKNNNIDELFSYESNKNFFYSEDYYNKFSKNTSILKTLYYINFINYFKFGREDINNVDGDYAYTLYTMFSNSYLKISLNINSNKVNLIDILNNNCVSKQIYFYKKIIMIGLECFLHFSYKKNYLFINHNLKFFLIINIALDTFDNIILSEYVKSLILNFETYKNIYHEINFKQKMFTINSYLDNKMVQLNYSKIIKDMDKSLENKKNNITILNEEHQIEI